MRISDWSSDVCSSDLDVFAVDLVNVAALAGQAHLIVFSQNWPGLKGHQCGKRGQQGLLHDHRLLGLEARQAAFHEVELGLMGQWPVENTILDLVGHLADGDVRHAQARLPLRSEEHTSELQSLMRISYAVFCLKTQTQTTHTDY